MDRRLYTDFFMSYFLKLKFNFSQRYYIAKMIGALDIWVFGSENEKKTVKVGDEVKALVDTFT